jgi:pterin-4a-carbinolamine dehydratase
MARVPGFCPEGEEVKKMEVNTTNTEKRGSYLSRELRIKIYNDVIAFVNRVCRTVRSERQ